MLFTLIDLYMRESNAAWAKLIETTGELNPLQAWREDRLAQLGEYPNGLRYQFHGVGCVVSYGDKEIDFDLPDGTQPDGFDLWKLKCFLAENEDHLGFQGWREWLEPSFNRAKEQRTISQRNWDRGINLYYVSSLAKRS